MKPPIKSDTERGAVAPSATCSPRVALSVRQPWAWLIVNGFKDIENRTWPTRFRGRIYIHAGKGMTEDEYLDAFVTAQHNGLMLPPADDLERGGIVGEVEIVDSVTESESEWFFGPHGFVLRDAKPLPFSPCRGALGFFRSANDQAEASGARGRPIANPDAPAALPPAHGWASRSNSK